MAKRKQYFFTCLKCNRRKPVEEEAYNAGKPGICWKCYHKQADIDEREFPEDNNDGSISTISDSTH